MNDSERWEALKSVLEALEGPTHRLTPADQLEVIELAYPLCAHNARLYAVSLPGGFSEEQSRQLAVLAKQAALVREAPQDLEADRLIQEGDIRGLLNRFGLSDRD